MLKAEGEMPLRGLVETQARHLPRGSTAILITPSVRDDTVLVVDYLGRRGLRPVVVFLDAASFGGEAWHTYPDRTNPHTRNTHSTDR